MSEAFQRIDRHPATSDGSETMPTQFAVLERSAPPAPHFLECNVQRALLSEPAFQFPSLVIRRMKNGICLEGVLITDEDAPDVCDVLRETCGVDDVVNHLVVCRSGTAAVAT